MAQLQLQSLLVAPFVLQALLVCKELALTQESPKRLSVNLATIALREHKARDSILVQVALTLSQILLQPQEIVRHVLLVTIAHQALTESICAQLATIARQIPTTTRRLLALLEHMEPLLVWEPWVIACLAQRVSIVTLLLSPQGFVLSEPSEQLLAQSLPIPPLTPPMLAQSAREDTDVPTKACPLPLSAQLEPIPRQAHLNASLAETATNAQHQE